ncbi:MAG: hypothetical protein HY238_11660, partial [Acidobacteria bacterium]|nr:hypothetical protein [Acidobacteriota bacterium]
MRKSVWLGVFVAVAALGIGVYLFHGERPAKAQAITLDSSLVALLPADATTL